MLTWEGGEGSTAEGNPQGVSHEVAKEDSRKWERVRSVKGNGSQDSPSWAVTSRPVPVWVLGKEVNQKQRQLWL